MTDPRGQAEQLDAGTVEARHPAFAEFRDRVLTNPEARAAYEHAENRFALATLKTPHGFELGDVIAETVLASDWLAAHDAQVAAAALREAADDFEGHICVALRGSDGEAGHPGEFISVNQAQAIVQEVIHDRLAARAGRPDAAAEQGEACTNCGADLLAHCSSCGVVQR
jgi:hypothetical protein